MTAVIKVCSCGRQFTQADWDAAAPVLWRPQGIFEEPWRESINCPSCGSTIMIELDHPSNRPIAPEFPGVTGSARPDVVLPNSPAPTNRGNA